MTATGQPTVEIHHTIRRLLGNDLESFISMFVSGASKLLAEAYGEARADQLSEMIEVTVRYALVGDRTPDSNYDPVTGFGFTRTSVRYALRLVIRYIRNDMFSGEPPDDCEHWLGHLEHLARMRSAA